MSALTICYNPQITIAARCLTLGEKATYSIKSGLAVVDETDTSLELASSTYLYSLNMEKTSSEDDAMRKWWTAKDVTSQRSYADQAIAYARANQQL